MRKSIYPSLAIILCIISLGGARLWLQRQEAARVQARADAQWDEVLKLHRIVHVTGLETIEAQVSRTDLTPEYRQFLTDNLPSWKLYLEVYAYQVDMVVEEFLANDPTTMDEVRQWDQILAELTARVMMPWMRMAQYFPNEKVAR